MRILSRSMLLCSLLLHTLRGVGEGWLSVGLCGPLCMAYASYALPASRIQERHVHLPRRRAVLRHAATCCDMLRGAGGAAPHSACCRVIGSCMHVGHLAFSMCIVQSWHQDRGPGTGINMCGSFTYDHMINDQYLLVRTGTLAGLASTIPDVCLMI